jgi:hypothetical protein
MLDDLAVVEQLGYECGVPISLQVHREMRQLAELDSKIGSELDANSR